MHTSHSLPRTYLNPWKSTNPAQALWLKPRTSGYIDHSFRPLGQVKLVRVKHLRIQYGERTVTACRMSNNRCLTLPEYCIGLSSALQGVYVHHAYDALCPRWPSPLQDIDELRLWLQEERTAKGELKQLLASTVQSERAADKKLAEVSAELEAASAKLAKAEAALQVSAASSLVTYLRGLTILLRHHALFTSGRNKITRCLSCFA